MHTSAVRALPGFRGAVAAAKGLPQISSLSERVSENGVQTQPFLLEFACYGHCGTGGATEIRAIHFLAARLRVEAGEMLQGGSCQEAWLPRESEGTNSNGQSPKRSYHRVLL